MAVGVLDEIDPAGQLIHDQPQLPVPGLQGGEVLGGQGYMGASSPR